jgi:anthranilate phosphoribosyltransferase
MTTLELLKALLAGHTLSEDDARDLFERCFAGELEEAQLASALSLIQSRGPTIDELTGAAKVMRSHATAVPVPDDPRAAVIDTCGTGGAPKTFNISTAAAIVAAAASPHHDSTNGDGVGEIGVRVLVAKHGNRSRTGRGSAEVLAQLGVNIDAPPQVQGACLEQAGVCFCFAIRHHPAAKHAAGVRKALAFPTMFNLLGPMTNPAGAPRQVMGIYDKAYVEKVAGVLARLGSVNAMVVHGDDGLDEITLTGSTTVGRIENGSVRMQRIDPTEFGLDLCDLDDLRETDIAGCADAVRGVLDGSLTGPKRDVVLLNAAAGLVVAGAAIDLSDGLKRAADAIDSSKAIQTLDTLAAVSNA